MASDFLDFCPLAPSQFERIGWRSMPPCNGGSAKRPKDPPAQPAPVRADSAEGEQANITASRRQGLRKTINPANPLAPATALGSMGKLGAGGEGVMTNTYTPPAGSMVPKMTFQGGRRA
jgi:hypothetical protein